VTSLVQQTFGEAAADYAASAVHARRPSLARLIELANPKPSWRVLDIANGARACLRAARRPRHRGPSAVTRLKTLPEYDLSGKFTSRSETPSQRGSKGP
jgi:hypothetical protein